MKKLTLFEYRTESGIALDQEDISALRALAPSVQIAPSREGPGLYDLTPGSDVGAVLLPTFECVISPKIPIDRLLFLLSYTVDPTAWREHLVDLEPETGLVEGMGGAFLAVVRRVLRRGLLQGYRIEEEALATVRGRIRFDDQIRYRHGVFPPVEVRHDEFTEDIEHNRLLKAALVRLERLRIRSPRARRELRAQRAAFERVATCDYHPAKLPTIQYSRLTEHYRPAIQLAKLILRSTSIEIQHGRVAAASLLVDMNQAFEDFVVLALREELKLSEQTFPQGCTEHPLHLDLGARVTLKPDISWWEAGRCVFIGDVKYKTVTAAGVNHPDLYQLLAYTEATDLPTGLLIYASGETESTVHEVVNAGKRLEVMALELGGQPAEILSQISGIAETIRRMRDMQKSAAA